MKLRSSVLRMARRVLRPAGFGKRDESVSFYPGEKAPIARTMMQLLVSQCKHRVDLHRTDRWDVACEQSNRDQHQRD